MDIPDAPRTRRAVLAGVGTVAATGGVVYAGSQLEGQGTDTTRTAPTDGPQFHSSSETTGFGIELGGHPIMGRMDAPLDMYYWGDYQCPFCRRFEENTLPTLIDDHVSSGTVRVVFIEFPYLSEGSMTAAVMDRCVWRQVRDENPRRYWEWHSTVYDNQGEKDSGWASESNLLEITRGVDGIDADAVDTCMQENRSDIEPTIDTDVERARQLGLRGSPAFVIYDRDSDEAGKLVGAQPATRFDEAIETVENA